MLIPPLFVNLTALLRILIITYLSLIASEWTYLDRVGSKFKSIEIFLKTAYIEK